MIARSTYRPEARRAMPGTRRHLVAVLLSAAFVWTLVLAVAPQLHERIHADASRVEHTCAVTFVASGGYEHSAAPTLIVTPSAPAEFLLAASPLRQCVPSPFLSASIFEHAPPASA